MNTAQDAFQQLLSLGQQQYNTVYPWEQQSGNQYMQTLMGVNTPYMQAFRAPVINQTQQDIRTMQNQGLGSMANPDAMWQDVWQQGQQQAGMAGLNAMTGAQSGLQSLISGGLGAFGNWTQAGGQGMQNLGEYWNTQFNQDINSLLSGVGRFAGAGGFGGGAGAGAGGAGAMGGMVPFNPTTGLGSVEPFAQASGATPAATSTGGSAPVSSTGGGMGPLLPYGPQYSQGF